MINYFTSTMLLPSVLPSCWVPYLDFFCGDILLSKFLALKSVEQTCLANISVTTNNNFHWKEKKKKIQDFILS